MLRNYLIVASRNLRRNVGYTAINVLGLALGMAACLLIGLYVGDELSYDDFHHAADRIYVFGRESRFMGRQTATSYSLASTLESSVPAVQQAVRTLDRPEVLVRHVARGKEDERRMLLADASFFQFFRFPLLRGEPASVLATPDAAVITASMARDFFGDADPIGETLRVEMRDTTHTVTVRGVARNVLAHSTIQFDIVAPLRLLPADRRASDSWGRLMFRTYARVHQPLPPDTLAAQAGRAVSARLKDIQREPPTYLSLPLPSLYLSDLYDAEGFRGQQRYLYIFGSIALFILLIAAINYVNLVTVQAQQRAKEVGMRKALGAHRMQVAGQFLSESVLVSAAALAVALGGAFLALPVFNASFGTELVLFDGAHEPLLAGLSAFVLAVGIVAGGYPAAVLSRFRPVRVLRGTASGVAHSGGWLRRGLVVFQFAISAALIVGTLVVYQQLNYAQSKNLGFDGEQVAVIQPPEDVVADGETIKRQLSRHPSVTHVSVARGMPAHIPLRLGLEPKSVAPAAQTDGEVFLWAPITADDAFVETLGLELVAGRSFRHEPDADAGKRFLLNEAAARELGWSPEEAVGKSFGFGADEQGTVIGVIKNFHITSLREAIIPVTLSVGEPRRVDWSRGHVRIAVKLAPDGIRAGMEHVRATFARLAPDAPLDYQFLDDVFDAMYRSEERLSHIFTVFAGVAILIACMGLFGLAAFAAERRTKEIGIRKVLGASLTNVIGLLSKEFAVLVVMALGVGMPVAYWSMANWLEGFAYRIALGPGLFAAASGLALVIALATVGTQALRAARTDPAKALRYE